MTTRRRGLARTVAAALSRSIRRGRLHPGDRLPSITAICRDHTVSAITARAALRHLVDEGLARSRPGSGFFVAERRPEPAAARPAIGLLLGSLASAFFAEVIRGAEPVARAAGYDLLVADAGYSLTRESERIAALSGRVAGLLAVPIDRRGNQEAYATLARTTPLVFLDSRIEAVEAPLVSADNEHGGWLAARHLLAQRPAAVVAILGQEHTSFLERLHGFRRALAEANRPADERAVIRSAHHNENAGVDGLRAYLARADRRLPVAVFALNDRIAAGCCRAAREAGYRVGEEVLVCGYDDIEAPLLDPPLTSIRQDPHSLGAEGCAALLARIGGTIADPPRRRPELIERASSQRSPAPVA